MWQVVEKEERVTEEVWRLELQGVGEAAENSRDPSAWPLIGAWAVVGLPVKRQGRL